MNIHRKRRLKTLSWSHWQPFTMKSDYDIANYVQRSKGNNNVKDKISVGMKHILSRHTHTRTQNIPMQQITLRDTNIPIVLRNKLLLRTRYIYHITVIIIGSQIQFMHDNLAWSGHTCWPHTVHNVLTRCIWMQRWHPLLSPRFTSASAAAPLGGLGRCLFLALLTVFFIEAGRSMWRTATNRATNALLSELSEI